MSTNREIQSINPATEELLATFDPSSESEIDAATERAREAFGSWRRTPVAERTGLLCKAAERFRADKQKLAATMTAEMGKPIVEAEGEVEKCAWVCEYYAERAPEFLMPQARYSSAAESYVELVPLGCVLAIMPWNFPYWQVLRFAAPALSAGNTAILKHAANVPQCAAACEELFRASGFPDGVFQNLYMSGERASRLVEHDAIAAVTLTGSERAGAAVAEAAGRVTKKAVLELGGSDPFIVLEDADLAAAVEVGVRARFQNTGQSCIAAKRFIVADAVFDRFRDGFVEATRALRVGDPRARDTQVGPLARNDLREELERQVGESVAGGATVLTGGKRVDGKGYFFEPTVISEVTRDMPVFREEVFGPVAALIRVAGVEEAIEAANDSPYGLGASLWTADASRARCWAPRIEAGQVFINGMVASDPRLPFGGVKRSGYGRELSELGMREFMNVQTVWIGPKLG